MGDLHLVFDNKTRKVRFSKTDRLYYSFLTDIPNGCISDTVLITNKPGNFDLRFINKKSVYKNGMLLYYEYDLADDERGIVYRIYV